MISFMISRVASNLLHITASQLNRVSQVSFVRSLSSTALNEELCDRTELVSSERDGFVEVTNGHRESGDHRKIQVFIQHVDCITSTQTVLESSLSSLGLRDHFFYVLSTDFQTEGRGRGEGRKWITPVGSKTVTMSVAFKIPETKLETSPSLTQILALSATKEIKSLILNSLRGVREIRDLPWDPVEFFESHFAVQIKWPNDIVCNGCKIGGIVAKNIGFYEEIKPEPQGSTTSMERTSSDHAKPRKGCELSWGVVLGIGINVDVPMEELKSLDRPRWPPSSVRGLMEKEGGSSLLGVGLDESCLRDRILRTFSVEFSKWSEEAPEKFLSFQKSFRKELGEHLMFLHQEVLLNVGAAGEEKLKRGTVEGVALDGALLLKNSSGDVEPIYAGEFIFQ